MYAVVDCLNDEILLSVALGEEDDWRYVTNIQQYYIADGYTVKIVYLD